jgi:hypothetical protein
MTRRVTTGRASERGLSLVEVTVAVGVLAVALTGLVGAMTLAAKQSALSSEMSIAQDAARAKAEEMHGTRFDDLLPTYRGHTFAVTGLTAVPSNTSVGRVVLHTRSSVCFRHGAFSEQMFREDNPGSPGTAAHDERTRMGLPMDLNGDGDATDDVCRELAQRVVARIVVEWRGAAGDQEVDLCVVIGRP